MNNREAFEAWYKIENCGFDDFSRNKLGNYDDFDVRRDWGVWQAALASQAQQTEKKQLSRQDILKVFYTLKDKDKHFPMIEREISSALGSQLFVYGWLKAVEFDIQPPAPEGDKP